jgi:hypothetical protein
MGTGAPSGARSDVRAWIERLEAEPRWTARYRERLAARGCDPCDLVLLLGRADEYPRSARATRVIDGWVVVVGSVAEVLDTLLPVNERDLTSEQARALRDHAHAIVVEGFTATAFRFRPPSV